MSTEESGSDDIIELCKLNANWWKHILTDYKYENTCEIYLITSFSSCIFGVVWFTLFLMCGKGGHDIPMQVYYSFIRHIK